MTVDWDQVAKDLARRDVESHIRASSEVLCGAVWPAIRDKLGGGQLIPVETVRENDFARILDTAGGVDAWQHYKSPQKEWIRGIASRVQFGDRDWQTHTVRYRLPSGRETELHKRLRYNRGAGVVGPHLTIHAYAHVPSQRILSVGIARTADLLEVVMKHQTGEWDWPIWDAGTKPGPVYIRTNGRDSNQFLAVEWSALRPYQHFLIVRPPTQDGLFEESEGWTR